MYMIYEDLYKVKQRQNIFGLLGQPNPGWGRNFGHIPAAQKYLWSLFYVGGLVWRPLLAELSISP